MITPKKLTLLFFGLFVVSHAKGCSPRDIAEREGRFPYVVSIQDRDHGVNKSLCTGSIVAERFVITVARCILTPGGSFKTGRFQIVAGLRDLNSASSDHRVVADVVELFVPAEYHPESRKSNAGDIAVLKLSKDFDIEKNPNIGKVDLPVNDQSYTGVEARVIGFGWNNITKAVQYPETSRAESLNAASDGKIRYAKVEMFEYDDCVKLYDESIRGSMTKKHICARVKQCDPVRVENVCLGDNGSPLVHNYVLIGVANASPLMCRDRVYTRVVEFTEFIKNVLSGNIDKTVRSSGTLI